MLWWYPRKVADHPSSCSSVRSLKHREFRLSSKEKLHVLPIAVWAPNLSRTKAVWIAILSFPKILMLTHSSLHHSAWQLSRKFVGFLGPHNFSWGFIRRPTLGLFSCRGGYPPPQVLGAFSSGRLRESWDLLDVVGFTKCFSQGLPPSLLPSTARIWEKWRFWQPSGAIRWFLNDS